jgi:putative FmdB family regulatory protein
MPMYEYKCGSCEKTEDVIVSIDKRDEPMLCSDCDGEVFRVLSAPGLVWAPTAGGYK